MKIKNVISSALLSSYLFIQNTTTAFAQLNPDGTGVYNHEGDDVATLGWIVTLAQNVLGVALRLVGIAAFVMLLVGGITFLTSGGDPKATEKAKQTITMAIAGLILAAVAWIIFYVISSITGVDILNFSIPTLNL